MALDIIKLYIGFLSEFFLLSDIAVMLTTKTSSGPPPLLPSFSNVFTTGQYLIKILTEVQDTINEVNALEISNEVGSGLKALLESTNWRFVDVLVTAWLRGQNSHPLRGSQAEGSIDANIFYHLEAWIASPSEPSATLYLSSIEILQRHATTSAFKLAGGVELSTSLTKQIKQNAIAPVFTAKITKAFLDAMYAFLEGFVILASDESPAATKMGSTSRKAFVQDPSVLTGTGRLELLDLNDSVCAL